MATMPAPGLGNAQQDLRQVGQRLPDQGVLIQTVHPVTVRLGCRQSHEDAALLRPVCILETGSETHHQACRLQAACTEMALARCS